MKNIETSILSNGLIWFGAGISIAEILTGTFIAPLGFTRGIAAIIIGHIIGCVLFYLAGLIGAKTKQSAMQTVKCSFGEKGSLLFSSLNIIQLIGWTAIMIGSGAIAAQTLIDLGGTWIWNVIIGGLIILWLFIGLQSLTKLNIIAMLALLILTIVLGYVIFQGNSHFVPKGTITFGQAVELSVAMPLSWLPLISDYTRFAKQPKKATAISSISYFIASCFMYIIGLSATIFTGQSDIAQIMLTAGLGGLALMIIIFSTVTTTFLDAYSAGVSSESISNKLNGKVIAIIVSILGIVLATFTPINKFEGFLFLIGSVFAPMIAILVTDFYILKRNYIAQSFVLHNLVIWAIGFILYRLSMNFDTPIGNTIPVMIFVIILSIMADKILMKLDKK